MSRPRIPDRVFEAFRAYVEEIAPPGVTTTVQYLGGGLPSLTPMDHPATKAAARALEATFGQAPVFIREGGSIPVSASFAKNLILRQRFASLNSDISTPSSMTASNGIGHAHFSIGGTSAVTRA